MPPPPSSRMRKTPHKSHRSYRSHKSHGKAGSSVAGAAELPAASPSRRALPYHGHPAAQSLRNAAKSAVLTTVSPFQSAAGGNGTGDDARNHDARFGVVGGDAEFPVALRGHEARLRAAELRLRVEVRYAFVESLAAFAIAFRRDHVARNAARPRAAPPEPLRSRGRMPLGRSRSPKRFGQSTGYRDRCMKALSGKELAKLLEQRGWELRRIQGSHHIYLRPGSKVAFPFRSTATSR